MSEQPTKKQVKEFWEWCGWRYKPDELCGDPRSPHIKHSYGWQAPDDYKWHTFPPDIALNNLFKYAVPFLLEEYNIESYSFKQSDNWYYSETNIWRKGSTKHNFEVLHDEHIAKHFEQGADLDKIAALALFWALWQVKGEK